jgi:hypothetical protein
VDADPLRLSRYQASVVDLVNDRLTARIVAGLTADGVRAIVLKGVPESRWMLGFGSVREPGD